MDYHSFAWGSAILTCGIIVGWVLRWWIVDLIDPVHPNELQAYDNGFKAGYEQCDYDRHMGDAMATAKLGEFIRGT